MNFSHPIRKIALLLCVCWLPLCFSGCTSHAEAAAERPYHLVILGDPHLPGRDLEKKEQVRETINSWPDVDMVIAVGDICAEFGTEDEYQAAMDYFAKLHKPLWPVAGNHDFFHEKIAETGALGEGSAQAKEQKLARFKTAFGLKEYFYSKQLGNYLLIFLSTDSHQYLSGISERQLAWLRDTLQQNAKLPTIIIFHGPLNRTLRDYRHFVNTANFIAQPVSAIDGILASNPQVFLWLSGHTHTPPLEESYASPVNLYKDQVMNIHNKDMNRGVIWTNSVFLYPDKVLIRTYNHQDQAWLPQLERTISPPALKSSH